MQLTVSSRTYDLGCLRGYRNYHWCQGHGELIACPFEHIRFIRVMCQERDTLLTGKGHKTQQAKKKKKKKKVSFSPRGILLRDRIVIYSFLFPSGFRLKENCFLEQGVLATARWCFRSSDVHPAGSPYHPIPTQHWASDGENADRKERPMGAVRGHRIPGLLRPV